MCHVRQGKRLNSSWSGVLNGGSLELRDGWMSGDPALSGFARSSKEVFRERRVEQIIKSAVNRAVFTLPLRGGERVAGSRRRCGYGS